MNSKIWVISVLVYLLHKNQCVQQYIVLLTKIEPVFNKKILYYYRTNPFNFFTEPKIYNLFMQKLKITFARIVSACHLEAVIEICKKNWESIAYSIIAFARNFFRSDVDSLFLFIIHILFYIIFMVTLNFRHDQLTSSLTPLRRLTNINTNGFTARKFKSRTMLLNNIHSNMNIY